MNKKTYGVKVILQSVVKNIEGSVIKNSFEEMILSVKAVSFDEAFEKAEKYAEGYCQDHENPHGDTVSTKILSFLDAFESYDEENDVAEIYSQKYDADGNECSEEYLRSFLNKEFNGSFQ